MLQCGSYAFMDADYGRILDKDGSALGSSKWGEWENALLFNPDQRYEPHIPKPIRQSADAGSQSFNLWTVPAVSLGRDDVEYTSSASVRMHARHHVDTPARVLKIKRKNSNWLPGHCDPTCKRPRLVRSGVRNGKVETLWPRQRPRQDVLIQLRQAIRLAIWGRI